MTTYVAGLKIDPRKLHLIYGREIEFWIKYSPNVADLINGHNLKASEVAYQSVPLTHSTHELMDDPIPIVNVAKGGGTEAGRMVRWPHPVPGGLRGPHLHHKGEVFSLTLEQWKEFSTPILNEVRTRLERIETVPFDQLVDIASAMEGLR